MCGTPDAANVWQGLTSPGADDMLILPDAQQTHRPDIGDEPVRRVQPKERPAEKERFRWMK